jgi:hypothetical protein
VAITSFRLSTTCHINAATDEETGSKDACTGQNMFVTCGVVVYRGLAGEGLRGFA